MSFQYLLDTNTLSEPARPIPNANVLHKLDVCQSEIATASIVVHELMYGCLRLPESRRREVLWSYIQESVLSLPVFNYDQPAAEWHARVTNNVADFQFFDGLRIENWFLE
jgi:tRNA(fMet)-specific endonuclease VapC